MLVRKLWKLNGKLLLRSGPICFCGIAMLVFTHLTSLDLYRQHADSGMLYFSQQHLSIGWIFLVGFLFLSYLYLYKMYGTATEEAIGVTMRGKLQQWMIQFTQLTGLLVLLFVSILAYPVALAVARHISHPMVLLHLLCAYLLYCFLPGLLGIVLGSTYALYARRYVAAGLLFFTVFLFSPLLQNFLQHLEKEGTNPFMYADLFDLAMGGYIDRMTVRMSFDYLYGIPMEALRWNKIWFWLLLGGTLLAAKMLSGKKGGAKIAVLLLSSLCVWQFFGYCQGGDILYLGNDPAQKSQPVYLYEDQKKWETADFAVDSYEIDLTIERELTATATVHLRRSTASQRYPFTLNAGLKILSVTDIEGRPLTYKREYDYLEVYPSTDSGQLTDFMVRYRGSCNNGYCNRQGVRLIGSMAFYPIEGYRPVSTYGYGNGLQELSPRNFVLTLRGGPKYCTTNLSRDGDLYIGRSNSLSIVGGLIQPTGVQQLPYSCVFAEQDSEKAVDAPAMRLSQFRESLSEARKKVGIKTPLEELSILPCGSGNSLLASDHLLVQYDTYQQPGVMIDYTLPPDNGQTDIAIKELRLALISYLNDPARYVRQLLLEDTAGVQRQLYRAVLQQGESTALQAVYRYLCGDGPDMDATSFLHQLSGGTAQ